MGNENATLLFAVPHTNWVNRTFLWATSKRSISASFLLPGESCLSLILKRLGATR
jgi:hypothetical protein